MNMNELVHDNREPLYDSKLTNKTYSLNRRKDCKPLTPPPTHTNTKERA